MAEIKISDLPTMTSVSDSHLLAVDTGTKTYKITVGNYNLTATTTARQYAEAAATSAGASSTSATQASNSANQAYSAVTSAGEQATNAANSATSASTSATNAQTYAQNAYGYSQTSLQHAGEAEDYATLSRSWAEGGTGTRPNEDVDNSEYWAGVSRYYADNVIPSVMIENNRLYAKIDNISFLVSNNRLYVKA